MDKGKDNSEILKRIKKIEGPVSYSILKPTGIDNFVENAPTIMLIGDIHQGRFGCKRCNKETSCFSFYSQKIQISDKQEMSIIPFVGILDIISSENNLTFDIFTEYWVDLEKRLQDEFMEEESYKPSKLLRINEMKMDVSNKTLSSLTDFSLNTKKCINPKGKKCPYNKKLRFHMTDIRSISLDEKYPAERIIDNVFIIFNELYSKIGYLQELFRQGQINEKTFNYNYVEHIKSTVGNLKIFYENTILNFEELGFEIDDFKYIKNLFSNFDLREYLNQSFIKKKSVLYKELKKLNPEFMESLLDMMQKIIKEDGEQFNQDEMFDIDMLDFNFFNLNKTLKTSYFENLGYITKRLIYMNSVLVDLYTIARMFKTPVSGKISDMSFIYLGNHHIMRIHKILTKLDLYQVVKEKNIYEYEQLNLEKLVSKCLDL